MVHEFFLSPGLTGEQGGKFATSEISLLCGRSRLFCQLPLVHYPCLLPILHPEDYQCWIANIEPDPNDLLTPFPADLMTMWPVSSRVGNPRNNTTDIVEEIPLLPENGL